MNMPLVLLNRRRRGGAAAFSPAGLFALAEPGVWYDPSDLTTLFQDTAGTTPVTTPGQTVARINDKSGRGNNATQATLASRPTYGIVPLGGRRNLLTWSEEVDNAAWTKSNITVSANAGVAPNGTTTADKLVPNATTANFVILQSPTITLSPVTQTIYAKAAGWSYVNMTFDGARFSGSQYVTFNLSGSGSVSGSNIATGSIQAVGDGWYRCIATATPASAGAATVRYMPANSNVGFFPTLTGNGTDGILIWGAQLETGSSATAYQRVGSAFDVTEAGVSSLSYLSFDGVDDFLITPTITPGIDRAQVFAGITRVGTSGTGVIAELGAGGPPGSFNLYRLTATDYQFINSGTIERTTSGVTAPTNSVLVGLGDISGDTATLRINGAQVAQATGDQGTGNYSSTAIRIGRRNGATLPVNMNLFSLIVRFGTNLDAGTITNTETWVNGKTGAYT